MHRSGHLGAGLLLYAPIAYGLWLTEQPLLALVGLLIVTWTTSLPDIDLRIPALSHRGGTHTVGFVLVVAVAWAVIGWIVGTQFAGTFAAMLEPTSATLPIEGWPRIVDQFQSLDGWALGSVTGLSAGAAIVSHLLADLLTPMGLRPFWPVSSMRYSLDVCRASSRVGNTLLFVAGVVAIALVGLGG